MLNILFVFFEAYGEAIGFGMSRLAGPRFFAFHFLATTYHVRSARPQLYLFGYYSTCYCCTVASY